LVFIPLSDDNPRLIVRYPYVTWGIIGLNAVVWVVLQSGLLIPASPGLAMSWGVVPSLVSGQAVLPVELQIVPPWLTFITSLFLHGDVVHLAANLFFVWVFADNIEDSMGHVRFVVFYLLCGLAGGLCYQLSVPGSNAPLIGASSAVSGIIAAYLLLHPRVKIWVLLFARIPLRLTASWVILSWLAVQLGSLWFSGDDATAWMAHLGGFAAGALLTVPMKRSEVPLFGRPPKTIAGTRRIEEF
jgi:membrane associated rhomboid family serine protease